MRYVACKFSPGDTKGYTFSYDGDADLKGGDRVEVERSARGGGGVAEVEVMGFVEQPNFVCKPILRVVLAE